MIVPSRYGVFMNGLMFIDHYLNLPIWAQHIVFPVIRWLHIVCTCALVGGTLFYEFVVPKAIEELKEESQMAVLGRVRWIFRRTVLISSALLILTGVITTWRQWHGYQGQFEPAKASWAIHVGLAFIAMVIAIRLTLGDNVPKHPITWMRINLVILLVVIFASAWTRYIRLTISEAMNRGTQSSMTSGETR